LSRWRDSDFGPDTSPVRYVSDPNRKQFRDVESRQPAEEKKRLAAPPVECGKELYFFLGQ